MRQSEHKGWRGKRRRGWEEAVLGVRKSQCAARRASCRTSWFYPRWATNLPRNITARSSLQNGTAKIRDYIYRYIYIYIIYIYIHMCIYISLCTIWLSFTPKTPSCMRPVCSRIEHDLAYVLAFCSTFAFNFSPKHQHDQHQNTSMIQTTSLSSSFIPPTSHPPCPLLCFVYSSLYTSCTPWRGDGRGVVRSTIERLSALEHPSAHGGTSFTSLGRNYRVRVRVPAISGTIEWKRRDHEINQVAARHVDRGLDGESISLCTPENNRPASTILAATSAV